MLEEYELADLILVLSEKAEETFVAAGVAKEKLFRHQRGVDVERLIEVLIRFSSLVTDWPELSAIVQVLAKE